jgi:hypothetical protein
VAGDFLFFLASTKEVGGELWAIDLSFVYGDVNLDGVVDTLDFNILKDHFGKSSATRADGDVNGDGVIDLIDFAIIKQNFGSGAARTSASAEPLQGDSRIRERYQDEALVALAFPLDVDLDLAGPEEPLELRFDAP